MDINKHDLNTSLSQLKSMLQDHCISVTSQRLIIAQTLFLKHQHITAEQLHHVLEQTDSYVSKATVYNTLGLFVEKGLLNEIFIHGQHRYYDSNISPHNHIYNIDTGILSDLPDTGDLLHDFQKANLPERTHLEAIDVVLRVKNNSH